MKANAISRLADRLRLNAASMEHGSAESDIRAAADILEGVADLTVEYAGHGIIVDEVTRSPVSPRSIVRALVAAHLRADRLEQDLVKTQQKRK